MHKEEVYKNFDLLMSLRKWSLIIAVSYFAITLMYSNKIKQIQANIDSTNILSQFANKNGSLRDWYKGYCLTQITEKDVNIFQDLNTYTKKEFLSHTKNLKDPFLEEIFPYFPNYLLTKILEKTSEYQNRISTKNELFSAYDDFLIDWNEKTSLNDSIDFFFSDIIFSLIDSNDANKPVFDLINFLLDNKPDKSHHYHKHGKHLEVIAGSETPYLINKRIDTSSRTDLSNRDEFDFKSNTLTYLELAKEKSYRLVYDDIVYQKDSIILQLRFSANRPKIFEGNTYEDSHIFPSLYRWPVQKWNKKTHDVFINDYGDIYCLIRWPLISGEAKSPFLFLTTPKLQFNSQARSNFANLREIYYASDNLIDIERKELNKGNDLSIPLTDYENQLLKRFGETRERAEFKVNNISIPIVPGILFLSLYLLYSSTAQFHILKRLNSNENGTFIKEIAYDLPYPELHSGNYPFFIRIVKTFSPATLTCISLLVFFWCDLKIIQIILIPSCFILGLIFLINGCCLRHIGLICCYSIGRESWSHLFSPRKQKKIETKTILLMLLVFMVSAIFLYSYMQSNVIQYNAGILKIENQSPHSISTFQ